MENLHLNGMKKYLFLAVVCPCAAFAQISPADVARYRAKTCEKATISENTGRLFIPVPFGKSELNTRQIHLPKNAQVISVQLMFTRFRRSDRFKQQELNRRRLENLYKLMPEVFQDPAVDWNLMEQTGADDYGEAKSYFHGFRIDYRTLISTEKERKDEVDSLFSALREDAGSLDSETDFLPRIKNKKTDSEPVKFYETGPSFGTDPCDLAADAAKHLIYPKEALEKKISGRVEVEITVNKNGGVQDIRFMQRIGGGCEDAIKKYLEEMPLWNPAKNKTEKVNAYLTLIFLFGMESRYEETENCLFIPIYPPGKTPTESQTKKETAISTVLNRHTDWRNLAVVCDVTASMSPYIRDLMGWFRTNQNRIIHFSFFNDGDMTPDVRKQIGATGGIYPIGAISAEAVEKELERAMRAGFGGDIPENDGEALLDAERRSPPAERLVWIADNYALPRDKILLKQIKKPISLILCTGSGSLNPEYLTLAREAGASVHTLDGDLPDVSKMKEGESLIWKEREYKISKGKFTRVY